MDRLKQGGFIHVLSLIYMLIYTINSERESRNLREGESNQHVLVNVCSFRVLCLLNKSESINLAAVTPSVKDKLQPQVLFWNSKGTMIEVDVWNEMGRKELKPEKRDFINVIQYGFML